MGELRCLIGVASCVDHPRLWEHLGRPRRHGAYHWLRSMNVITIGKMVGNATNTLRPGASAFPASRRHNGSSSGNKGQHPKYVEYPRLHVCDGGSQRWAFKVYYCIEGSPLISKLVVMHPEVISATILRLVHLLASSVSSLDFCSRTCYESAKVALLVTSPQSCFCRLVGSPVPKVRIPNPLYPYPPSA